MKLWISRSEATSSTTSSRSKCRFTNRFTPSIARGSGIWRIEGLTASLSPASGSAIISVGRTGRMFRGFFRNRGTNPGPRCKLQSVRALTLVLVATAALATPPLTAQEAPATASVVGTVFDSIRIRPLAGARVRVDTSSLFTTTDADGKFLLQGVPAGMHELRIEHPTLDTLGIDLRSARLAFAAGSTTLHEFGTPSAERVVE